MKRYIALALTTAVYANISFAIAPGAGQAQMQQNMQQMQQNKAQIQMMQQHNVHQYPQKRIQPQKRYHKKYHYKKKPY